MYPEIESNGAVSIEEIEEFEKKYSISLPHDYKKFLSKYNGGMIKSSSIMNMEKN